MLCPLCHTENRDNAKFCKGCGRILAGEAAASAQPVSAEHYADAGPIQPAQSREPAPPPRHEDTVRRQDAPPLQPAAINATAPAAPVAPANADTHDAEDISAAPTQILTPQQMLALHQRRWQDELEREQRQHPAGDVSDMPTIVQPMDQPDVAGRDIADYPTIITPLPVGDGPPATPVQQPQSAISPAVAARNTTVAPSSSPAAPEAQPAASQPGAKSPIMAEESATTAGPVSRVESSSQSGGVQEEETTNEQGMVAKNAAAPSANDEEGSVEQTTGPEMAAGQIHTPEAANTTQGASGDSAQGQEASSFPLLAVGALVGARYEVTQVISDSAEEHIYAVTDHQGYQHCWNCGSEENAEGDEFCNDCGAELLNAPYVMHEYPLLEKQGGDARVLQGVIANTLVDQGHTYVIEQPQTTQIAFPNGVHLLASSDSDAGTVRSSDVNEDSTLALLFERVHESVSTPAGIFIVADGMGGHANGQGASRATIGVISERIVRELIMAPLSAEKSGEASKALDEEALLSLLHGSIEDANTTLCQINQRDKTDMGSTLTGFMLVGDHAYIFNVGDSRTYMLRDEKLYQLTNDHSLVGQLVAGGLIEPEDVYTHPQRNQIFRSIGDKLNVQIDLFKQQVHPGDILLSCSDGLWEMVRDPQITDILNQATDPQTACTQLIEAANANGGEDNVSAVIVFVR